MQTTKLKALVVTAGLTLLSGCASTQTKDAIDPWEGWNRNVQSFNDNVDNYVMKPVAKGYKWVTPGFVDQGVSNFFSNLSDIGVAANDALQGKFLQSGSDSARFLINTSAGVAGLVDVASLIDLPKHKEDFDQTLGYWGVPTGPYLVLPFFGPSTSRGVFGLLGDAAMNPISYTGIYFGSTWVSTAVSGGLGGLNAIDLRADNLGTEKIASEASVDRYQFFRDAYLANRNYLVKDGNVPEDDLLELEKKTGDQLSPFAPY